MSVIDEIRAAVHGAAAQKQKIAMFHFQVLKNAAQLDGLDPKQVCRELGVPATYATEFRKMLGLARLMAQEGVRLA